MHGRRGHQPLPMAQTFTQAVVIFANVVMVLFVAASMWAAALQPMPESAGSAGGDTLLAGVMRTLIAALGGVLVGGVSWLIQWPLYRYAGIGDIRRPFLWAAGAFVVVFCAGLAATAWSLLMARPGA